MPWPPHRRHRSAPSRLRYQDLFALRTDIPALSVTPASTNHSIELIEPTTPFLPGPRNVSILSPTNEQAALFGAGIASNQYGNDLLGFSNEYHFNLGAAEATFTQQPPTRNEVHRWNGTNTWTGSLQASPGLPLQYPSQPQLWANAPGHSFQSSPTLDPSLSQGLEPGGSSHSGNIQSHSPETASSPQELRLTREDMSTLTSRHEDWQTHAPLYLLNTTEKEIRVMMTRGDRTKVSAIAKPTRNVRNIFISRRMAKQLGLKIHPIAKQKRRQYLTPNGRENPVGFVEFDIESEAYDIHPTHVSAMVLNDSYNSLTAICLGVKFLEKAFGTKLLKTDRLSEIPKGTVDTNSVASYTMAQAFNSRMISRSGPKNPLVGNLHHQYANSQNMGRLATAIEPRQFVGSSPTSPAHTNAQSFLSPGTVSHTGGYSYPGYPSTMPSGVFSEPSATTGITAPSSVEEDSDGTPKPHAPPFNTGPLGPPSSGTINPIMLTSDNGNGSSSTNESFYSAPQQPYIENQMPMPSGEDGPYYYGHLQSGTSVPYLRLN